MSNENIKSIEDVANASANLHHSTQEVGVRLKEFKV